MRDRPIFITGAHRSGTTWLANMLALSSNTLIASEPFNLDSWAYKFDGLAMNWFTYAPALPQEAAIAAFRKVLERKTRKVYGRRLIQRYIPMARRGRLIIKDPIACLSSEWISNNFEIDTIVIVRHPAAFASSLKRMQWRFDFDHFLRQEILMKDLLYPYKSEIEARPYDIVEQAALLWKIIYTVLHAYSVNNPGWIVVLHERLSASPISEIADLYKTLNLKWTPIVEDKIRKFTQADNPTDPASGVAHQMKRNSVENIKRWKKILTEDEIDRVKRIVGDAADKFYPVDSWG